MKSSGHLILSRARWYVVLASIVVEFFMGEAAYGLESSLRHLRKWRFVVACLPIVSIILLATAASKWPRVHAEYEDSTSYREGQILRDRATKLESRLEQLTLEQARHERLLEAAIASTIAVQSDVRLINQKFDLVGWLAGSLIAALISAQVIYFYNIKLRKNLAQADLVRTRKTNHRGHEDDQ